MEVQEIGGRRVLGVLGLEFWILKPYQTNRVLSRVFWVWSLKGVRPRVSV